MHCGKEKRGWTGIALLAVLLGVAGPAEAAIIYSNFIDTIFGDGFYVTSTLDVTEGNSLFGDVDVATAFTPTGADYRIDKVEVGVFRSPFGNNELDVWVMDDNGGSPGSILEGFHFSNAVVSDFSLPPFPIIMADATVRPILRADTQYWLALSATGPEDSYFHWGINAAGPFPGQSRIGPQAVRVELGNWSVYNGPEGAFRLSGTVASVIPEPASFLLLGSSLLGLVGWRRRRPF